MFLCFCIDFLGVLGRGIQLLLNMQDCGCVRGGGKLFLVPSPSCIVWVAGKVISEEEGDNSL